MTFKVDYRDGAVLEWETTADGATYTRVEGYTPTIYLSAASRATLAELRGFLARRAGVVDTAVESWRTVWCEPPEAVLRLDVADLEAVDDVAHEVRGWGDPGEYRLYNVDLAREFRYWLETRSVDGDAAPVPPIPRDGRSLVTCELALPPKPLSDGDLAPLAVDGEVLEGDARDVLERVSATLARVDPDVLVVSSADLVPLLHRAAERHDLSSFRLGRLDGYEQLAGASTFESYGRVGHSPARYNVPGRAIVDRSNSFFWGRTTLAGLLGLVARSHKPLQETAWASIGNVLTSIQIRAAMDAGVLVPWNSWRHEQFKPASTLRDADRGGFTFAPAVGLHEDVHELDFAALYPSIMVQYNVSPDTVRCACHDRADVPGLGYSICDEEGYLVDVLRRLVEDRAAYTAALAEATDPERRAELAGRRSALKWILVSCFGYQGFSNAKFGRIECHEAINAFAREILLEAKARLEAHGWEVVHGIVDSVWVRARPGADPTPLADVAAEISTAVEIPIEHETRYDWIAFAPRRDGDVGALNRYFAKYADADAAGEEPADAFKLRGIEARQRHTPAFVADCQLDLLRTLDEHRSPRAVCERLDVHLSRLRAGRVDPADLVIARRVSKPLEAYDRATRNVAALERAERQAFAVAPGQSVEYVVVDDGADAADRVRLAYESIDRYDADFYADQLVRAAESVLSPLGWDRADVRRYLADTTETTLAAF